jgi:histidyl-tRNA synthetase
MSKAQAARGMRDFLPADVRRRQYVIGVIADVYERYGFEPLETPAVENLETLLGKYGEEGNKLVFKILKRGEGEASGEADLALRYDLTVPLARVVAEHRGRLPRFFKRYQVQPVWRADRPARGRFREFYQCDVDTIGSRSMVVEAEQLAAASDVLTRLGFAEFTIRLNHRQLLTALLEVHEIAADRHADALVALDKRDKIGRDAVVADMTGRGIGRAAAERLLSALDELERERSDEVLRRLADRLAAHAVGAGAVRDLTAIVALAEATPASGHLRLDASLARGLSYYTGAIMEIVVPDLPGSLAGGGRYDGLIGTFLGEDVPACGISLGLERILVVMGERGMFPPETARPPADVMVAVFDAAGLNDALALAGALRRGDGERGLRVEVYPEIDKIGKQFKYAAARGIPFVALAGEAERAAGVVAVKTLDTGAQESVDRGAVAKTLLEKLGTFRG